MVRGNSPVCALVLGVFLGAVCSMAAYAGSTERRYISFDNVRARALSMGGAYLSLEDDFSALLWNPAAFEVQMGRLHRKGDFFLNPYAPIVAAGDLKTVDLRGRPDRELTWTEGLWAFGLFLKGVVLSNRVFHLGFLSSEETLLQESGSEVLSSKSFFERHSHSLAGSVKLAPTVALGASVVLHYEQRGAQKARIQEGFSFGVMLKPSPRMNVGVVFFDLPGSSSPLRMPLERIGDETINGGVSFYFDRKMIFSIDLRNMNDARRAEGLAPREVHVGFERIVRPHFAVRGGGFRGSSKHYACSAGIGIRGTSRLRGRYNHNWGSDLLGYTYVLERKDEQTRRWHAVSFVLKF